MIITTRNRKIRIAALSGAAAMLVLPAQAGEGWYLGVGAGMSWPQETEYSTATNAGEIDYVHHARFIGSGGYKWPGGLRAEIEGGFVRYDVEDADQTFPIPLSLTLADDVKVWSALGNLLYDFPITENFALSVGGGLGVAHVEVDYASTRGGDYVFAWQGIAGVSYELSERADIQLDYVISSPTTAGTVLPGSIPISAAGRCRSIACVRTM